MYLAWPIDLIARICKNTANFYFQLTHKNDCIYMKSNKQIIVLLWLLQLGHFWCLCVYRSILDRLIRINLSLADGL